VIASEASFHRLSGWRRQDLPFDEQQEHLPFAVHMSGTSSSPRARVPQPASVRHADAGYDATSRCLKTPTATPSISFALCAKGVTDGISTEWNRWAGHFLQSLPPNCGAGHEDPVSDASAIAHAHSTFTVEFVHQISTGFANDFRWSMFQSSGASAVRWRPVRAATPPPPNVLPTYA
jgi:hypothetical protein